MVVLSENSGRKYKRSCSAGRSLVVVLIREATLIMVARDAMVTAVVKGAEWS